MRLPFVIVKRSTLDSLRFENASMSCSLTQLRKRFAAQILYGAAVPEDPRAAAEQAFSNVNGYTVASAYLSEESK